MGDALSPLRRVSPGQPWLPLSLCRSCCVELRTPAGGHLRLHALCAVLRAAGYSMNFSDLAKANARRAASTCAVRASNLRKRSISLLTRLRALTKTCLRFSGCSALPGKLFPPFSLASHLPLLLSRKRPRLAALLPQSHLQCMQLLAIERVDRRMMRTRNHLKFLLGKHAAFGLAGYRHLTASKYRCRPGPKR